MNHMFRDHATHRQSQMRRDALACNEPENKPMTKSRYAIIIALAISLAGCAAYQPAGPESLADAMARYRQHGCDGLEAIDRSFNGIFDKAADAASKLYWQQQLVAVTQVRTEKGCAIAGAKPRMGIVLRSVTPEQVKALGLSSANGAMIVQVLAGTPAERAGIQTNDVILGINGQKYASVAEFIAAIPQLEPDSTAEVLIWRDRRQQVVPVDFAPPSAKAKAAPTAATLMDAATVDFDAGSYADAARKYQQILKQSPDDTLAWYFYGQTMEKLRDAVGARDAYQRVLAIQPDGQVADYARQALAKLSPKKKAAKKK